MVALSGAVDAACGSLLEPGGPRDLLLSREWESLTRGEVSRSIEATVVDYYGDIAMFGEYFERKAAPMASGGLLRLFLERFVERCGGGEARFEPFGAPERGAEIMARDVSVFKNLCVKLATGGGGGGGIVNERLLEGVRKEWEVADRLAAFMKATCAAWRITSVEAVEGAPQSDGACSYSDGGGGGAVDNGDLPGHVGETLGPAASRLEAALLGRESGSCKEGRTPRGLREITVNLAKDCAKLAGMGNGREREILGGQIEAFLEMEEDKIAMLKGWTELFSEYFVAEEPESSQPPSAAGLTTVSVLALAYQERKGKERRESESIEKVKEKGRVAVRRIREMGGSASGGEVKK